MFPPSPSNIVPLSVACWGYSLIIITYIFIYFLLYRDLNSKKEEGKTNEKIKEKERDQGTDVLMGEEEQNKKERRSGITWWTYSFYPPPPWHIEGIYIYVCIWGWRVWVQLLGPALVLFLFYMNVSRMHLHSCLSFQPLTMLPPWVLLHIRWSIPLVSSWVTVSCFLAGNREVDLNLTTFSSLLFFCFPVFPILLHPPVI